MNLTQQPTMSKIPKKYNAQELEEKWLAFWEKQHTYRFDPGDKTRKIFSIDTPPPTVSGKMHLGHAFGNSQQDFIARFKRMKGFNVLQPFGTDDNGLPTKLLIEKLKKVRAKDIGRDAFRKLCFDTLEKELKPAYTYDWKRLGISCDFTVRYSTIDPHCRKVSQKSFLDLYRQGREYRAQAPAMFCPKCQTAISQVELEDKEIDSHFNDITFFTTDDNGSKEELVIATTRPELLPACVAVFYHPTDKRYQHLKGSKAKVPLFDLEVPILEDERADPEKGTGIVMCCTFGDQTDMEWQRAYKLPIREAIGVHGRMTALAKQYEGMTILDARKQIISDMKEAHLLKNQKDIRHVVNVHERCGTPIEFIHSKQWFIKYLDLKDDMLKWGHEFLWHPTFMKNRYDNWVNGLQWDWCISRQLPFGISFPVWYCKGCDEVILAREEDLPVDPTVTAPHIGACPKCGCKEFIPETDILNTWATSSLTPTIVKELFKGKPVYKQLIDNPMDLRPQGHDIISFWLFNTVVKSQLHYNMKPWDNVFINGWLLDPKGKKMSKSKGNVVEPQKLIQQYSADALRYMAGWSRLGEDLPFPEKDVIAGKKTITKLFNASKFVFMHLEDFDYSFDANKLMPIDRWLVSSFNEVVNVATKEFESYSFWKAIAAVDKFFWQVFCDNYLEFVKDRLYKPEVHGNESRHSCQMALNHVLRGIVKLYAPFLPYITEEIHSWNENWGGKADEKTYTSVHVSLWPEYDKALCFAQEQKTGELAREIIAAVRKFKSDHQVSQKHEVLELRVKCSEQEQRLLTSVLGDIKMTLSAKEITFEGFQEAGSITIRENFSVAITLAPIEKK